MQAALDGKVPAEHNTEWNTVMSTAGNKMKLSPNGNIFRVTGSLWGESAGHRWIPFIKGRDAELWSFLWSAPEKNVEQTIKTAVI